MSDSSVASGSPPAEAKRPPSPAPANEKRVSLACLRCRTKRARCSGDKPVCRACEKAKEECVWPTGRRRKRTRKEMEEEERRERLASAAADSLGYRDKRTPIRSLEWRQDQAPVESYPEPMAWEYPTPVWTPTMSSSSPTHPVVASSAPVVSPPTTFTDTRDRDYARPRPVPYPDGETAHDDQQYYRYQPGSAAPPLPGLNRLSIKPPAPHALPGSTPLPRFNSLPSPPSPVHELEDMFDEIGLPYPHLYIPLLDTFFQTMNRHFPSISRQRIEERLESGTMSAFFLNCICALAARFLPSARDDPSKACAPYIAKAQELIIVLIHLPTTDVVTGLLLLAWASYGQNSESGLWQYSGMAIRMAMDLGLHEVYEPYLSEAHVRRARLLFWSLFVTDRMLAFSTGRPPTIPEQIIEIPLPIDEDFVPDPARAGPGDPDELPQPTPFVHMVRLMVLCGRITTILAGCRGEPRTLLPRSGEESLAQLKGLQEELVQFYAELPDAMKWSVDAFKHQEARGYGDSFLTLHLWVNSVLAVLFYPELQERPDGNFSPITQNVERSTKLSLSSSRIIAECLVFADLFASHSYLTSPFAVQPIYVASLAFINDMKTSSNTGAENKSMHTVDNLLNTLARQNLAVLAKAVQRMEHYWVGISNISDILEQHASSLGFQRIGSTRKSRLSGVSMPDIPLPDTTSPIFTNTAFPQRAPGLVGPQAPTTLPPSMALEPGDTHSSPPNVNNHRSSSKYNREFYPRSTNSFDLGGVHLMGDYHGNPDTATSDGITTTSHTLPAGIKTGRI